MYPFKRAATHPGGQASITCKEEIVPMKSNDAGWKDKLTTGSSPSSPDVSPRKAGNKFVPPPNPRISRAKPFGRADSTEVPFSNLPIGSKPAIPSQGHLAPPVISHLHAPKTGDPLLHDRPPTPEIGPNNLGALTAFKPFKETGAKEHAQQYGGPKK